MPIVLFFVGQRGRRLVRQQSVNGRSADRSGCRVPCDAADVVGHLHHRRDYRLTRLLTPGAPSTDRPVCSHWYDWAANRERAFDSEVPLLLMSCIVPGSEDDRIAVAVSYA